VDVRGDHRSFDGSTTSEGAPLCGAGFIVADVGLGPVEWSEYMALAQRQRVAFINGKRAPTREAIAGRCDCILWYRRAVSCGAPLHAQASRIHVGRCPVLAGPRQFAAVLCMHRCDTVCRREAGHRFTCRVAEVCGWW
jgi:hypothetical protein